MKTILMIIICIFSFISFTSAALMTDNLEAAYTFNTNITVIDSTNNFTGGIKGSPTYMSSCVSGGCWNMSNSATDFVSLPVRLPYSAIQNNFTISFWAQMPTNLSAGGAYIMAWGNGTTGNEGTCFIRMVSETTTSIRTLMQGATFTDVTATAYQNKFYHWLIQRNNNNINIFVNGTKVNGAMSINNATSCVGMTSISLGFLHAPDNTSGFNGRMPVDEVYVWSRNLTVLEINQLSNASSASAFYPFGTNNTIAFNVVTPLNTTYTYNATPNFVGNISQIVGIFNITLMVNGSAKGMVQRNSTNVFNITSSILTTATPYSWWFNATDANNSAMSFITGSNYLYIAGGTSSVATKTCVFGAGSISLGSITGCV